VVSLLAACVACGSSERAPAGRAIPDDNLSYPVLITLENSHGATLGFGSGFYFNDDDAVYLVTAKHVIIAGLPDPAASQVVRVPDMQLRLLAYTKGTPPHQIVTTVNLATLRESGLAKVHPTQDVAVLKVGTFAQPGKINEMRQVSSVPGVTVAGGGIGDGIVGVSRQAIKTSDQILVGNDALIYGYPVSLGIGNPQFDVFHPLLRKALIAGYDAQRKSIIVDGPAYRGNSGGPVVQIEPEGFRPYRSLRRGCCYRVRPADGEDRRFIARSQFRLFGREANGLRSGTNKRVPTNGRNRIDRR
jgi:hypothetical protein